MIIEYLKRGNRLLIYYYCPDFAVLASAGSELGENILMKMDKIIYHKSIKILQYFLLLLEKWRNKMNPEHNMRYEGFIRKIFNNVGRHEDPLRLADTDVNQNAYTSGELTDLRLGVAYSLAKLLVRIETELGDTDKNYDSIKKWIKEIMNSNIKYKRIHEIIESVLPILNKL